MIERRPQHQVLIGPGTPVETKLTQTIDISSLVRRVRTVKSLASPVGTFEIGCTFQTVDGSAASFPSQVALGQLLVPDNVVTIRLSAGVDGTPLETVMIGYITGVQVHTTVNPDGQVVREIVVSGQDAGKFLITHDVPYFKLTARLMGEAEAGKRLAEGALLLTGSSIAEVLRTIFLGSFLRFLPRPRIVAQEVALLTHQSLETGGGSEFGSFLGSSGFWMHNGKWWTLFRSYLDEPWNEAFGDTIPDVLTRFPAFNVVPADTAAGEPVRDASGAVRGAIGTQKSVPYFIVVRPQPFDRATWETLATTTVRDAEIRLEQVRLGDEERVNLIMASPRGHFMSGADGAADWLMFDTIQYDSDSAERHGVRVGRRAETIYSDLGGAHQDRAIAEAATQGDGILWATLKQRARKLWNWLSINHRLWKGTWVIAGNPRVRIGTCVENEAAPGSGALPESEYTRRRYYVEQVVQDLLDGAHYLTHVGITRGQALGTFVEAKEPDRLLNRDPEPLNPQPRRVSDLSSVEAQRGAPVPGAFGPIGSGQASGG